MGGGGKGVAKGEATPSKEKNEFVHEVNETVARLLNTSEKV